MWGTTVLLAFTLWLPQARHVLVWAAGSGVGMVVDEDAVWRVNKLGGLGGSHGADGPHHPGMAGAGAVKHLFHRKGQFLISRDQISEDELLTLALEASGAEIITVAVRRVNLDDPKKPMLTDFIDPKKYPFLPNTAGCYNAGDALRTARPVDPRQPVLVAGDPERAKHAERVRDGVPVPPPLAPRSDCSVARSPSSAMSTSPSLWSEKS